MSSKKWFIYIEQDDHGHVHLMSTFGHIALFKVIIFVLGLSIILLLKLFLIGLLNS